jgi:anti-anti-sigma factor
MTLARDASSHGSAPQAVPTAALSGEGDRIVVSLRGELGTATVDVLAETLARAIADDDTDLVVDLAEVEFIDDAVVGVLSRGREFLTRRSRDLVLRAPSELVRSALDRSGLAGLIVAAAGEAGRGAGDGAPARPEWLAAPPELTGRARQRRAPQPPFPLVRAGTA